MGRRGPKNNTSWHARFLHALSRDGILRDACRKAGVPRSTVELHQETDPDFAAAVEAARADSVDFLERVALYRGVKGVMEPVFHEGRVVGHIRRPSDRLLDRLLQSRHERFRQQSVKVEAKVDGVTQRLSIELAELQPQNRAKLREILEDEARHRNGHA